MSTTPRASPLRSFLLLLLVLLALTGVIIALAYWAGDQVVSTLYRDGQTQFDRQKWLEADPEDGTREEMVHDLLKNYLKPSTSIQDALHLLGRPGPGDRYSCPQSLPEDAVQSLCYTVSMGLDPCTLLLGFNAAGQLVYSSKDCT